LREWGSIGKIRTRKRAAAGVLEQRGIALTTDDVLVDCACLAGVEQLGLEVLIADAHRELVDVRAARDRETGNRLPAWRCWDWRIPDRRGSWPFWPSIVTSTL
jgi:hypothetical protein